jgi:hypothetical protein
MAKNLFVYHEGTGTLIALSDKVYLIDADAIDERTLEDLEMGANVSEREHKGWRIDNYNMTNLFYGGNE